MKRGKNLIVGQQKNYSNMDLTISEKKRKPIVFQGWKRYEEAEEEE